MHNDPITEAWSRLRYFLKCMGSFFGEPVEIAAHWMISAVHRADILLWLRPLERAARIILLAEAEATKIAPMPPRTPRHREPKAAAKRTDVSHASSEAWRVSFRMVMPDRAKRTHCKRTLDPGICPVDPKPLAARFEALIRVALDPGPRVRRLALRLARRAFTYFQRMRIFRCERLSKNPMERAAYGIRELAWSAPASDTS